MESKSLSLIIPVYNEQDALQDTFNQLKKIKEESSFEMEIIFINDGSIDKSSEILKNVSEIKGFSAVNHSMNRGYGAALKTGIEVSKYSYIAFTDADGTYPNHLIPDFFSKIISNNADMLVGARIGKNVEIPFLRRIPKWFLGKLANYLTKTKIPDINSGFRIMKKDSIRKFLRILPDGFSLTTTITIAMIINGFSVCYDKIDYHKRQGKSKIRPIYDTLNFIKIIVRTSMLFDPLRVFIPIGLPLFLFGIILIIFQVIVYQDIGTVSVIIISTGLQIIAIAMLADIIVNKS